MSLNIKYTQQLPSDVNSFIQTVRDGSSDYIRMNSTNKMNSPLLSARIGSLLRYTKEKEFLNDNLSRNIGSNYNTNDSYGIPIGSLTTVDRVGQGLEKRNTKGITTGAYSGITATSKKGHGPKSGQVTPQNEVTDAIPWSTADHTYDANTVWGGGQGNIDGVSSILGLNNDEKKDISTNFLDLTQGTSIDHTYGPFGNYYSITYSLGLYSSTDEKTKSFITDSMLGFPLLMGENTDLTLDYSKGEIKKSPYKKYYVGIGTKGTTYIGKITKEEVDTELFDNKSVRYKFIDAGNDNMWSLHQQFMYAEAEGNKVGSPLDGIDSNMGVVNGTPKAFDVSSDIKVEDIIDYTNNKFLAGKYDTLINRFHTDEIEGGARANRDETQTAVSQYGASHGRNLLRKDHNGKKTHGYSNPYCRVWTVNHQYSTYQNVMRPSLPDLESNSTFMSYRVAEGQKNLLNYGVKTAAGLVRYAPSSDESTSIKRCMFSIENLAWKANLLDLHDDEKGDNGGRIMWFPPYDLSFNESSKASWQPHQFIGRGEQIYTYTNTDRDGNLSFTLLIDHPSIINSWKNQSNTIGDVDDVESEEQSILRFFAGCETLAKDNTPQDAKKAESSKKPETAPLQEGNPSDAAETVGDENKIIFYVFYPNNYTGIDDTSEEAMGYLLNGVDSGGHLVDGKWQKDKFPLGNLADGIGYEMNSGTSGMTIHDYDNGLCIDTKISGWEDANYDLYPCVDKEGKDVKYGHRVDKRVENEIMHKTGITTSNYGDYASFGLNSKIGRDAIINYHTDAKANPQSLYSFSEIYDALTNDENTHNFLSGYVETERVEILKNLFDQNEIASINVAGYASSHGTTASNNQLNEDRAKTLGDWFKKKINYSGELKIDDTGIGTKVNHKDHQALDAKIWRCARVILTLSPVKVTKLQEGISNINKRDNDTQRQIDEAKNIVQSNTWVDTIDKLKNQYPQLTEIGLFGVKTSVENNRAQEEAKQAKTATETNMLKNDTDYEGYGSEYTFFKDIVDTDPLLRHKVSDKIKFFDPAFHSITPEGFENRLAFLHQCTRPGPTKDASSNVTNARNMAFGAPPVCVLRIGDFYNTKIIITSVSIDYQNTFWDLNDEGIGVMPMMAKVSISFNFIGGSSLEGPVARLQNAVSFNYYANSEVHEARTKLYQKQ